MVTSRNLSKKKISTQNISISPYLKDWIERYVKDKHEKSKQDKRYKSVSAFYNYVMEAVMKHLEKGKTLDDLNKIIDEEVENFYDQITFKAITPLYNEFVEMNKYNFDNVNSIFLIMEMFHNFMKNQFKVDFYDLKHIAERLETFLKTNKLTKSLKFEILDNKLIVEYVGNQYSHIFHEHIKTVIILGSTIGLKLIDLNYNGDETYSRLIFEPTSLFNKKGRRKERRDILHENLGLLMNYYNIINSKQKHFWANLSKSPPHKSN